MIYFLVNNDYHLYLDMKLTKQLSQHKLGLIQIPYSLNVIDHSDSFSKIYHYPERLIGSLKGLLIDSKKIKSILKKVDDELSPDNNDVLLVHTEMDLLNQYIIQKFQKVGAKIFLLEDGTATMCYFNMPLGKIAIKDKIRASLLKYFFNFKFIEIKKYGVETLPVMKDHIFNGVIVKYGDKIKRKIPLYKLKSTAESIDVLYKQGAIFFNQPQYLWFITEKEYVKYIDDLLIISCNFSPFYFKFHPSDTKEIILQIKKVIKEKYSNIIIISENDIAENIIIKYPVQYSITFNSTATFNLMEKGIIPIFLNNMFNKLFPDDSFYTFGHFLKSINCQSPEKIEDIKIGFRAFKNSINDSDEFSIIDIINK